MYIHTNKLHNSSAVCSVQLLKVAQPAPAPIYRPPFLLLSVGDACNGVSGRAGVTGDGGKTHPTRFDKPRNRNTLERSVSPRLPFFFALLLLPCLGSGSKKRKHTHTHTHIPLQSRCGGSGGGTSFRVSLFDFDVFLRSGRYEHLNRMNRCTCAASRFNFSG